MNSDQLAQFVPRAQLPVQVLDQAHDRAHNTPYSEHRLFANRRSVTAVGEV
jgi:hypothetical protein